MDTSKYIGMFLQEVRENVTNLGQLMVKLEKDPQNIDLLQEIMRLSHSSKGITASVSFETTAKLFHALEDVFDAARKGKLTITPDITDTCFAAIDQITASLKSIEEKQQEEDCSAMTESVRAMLAATPATGKKTGPKGPTPKKRGHDLKGITLDTLDTTVSHIRVETEKIDALTNLAGELTMMRQQLRSASDDPKITPLFERFDRYVDELNQRAIDMRLVPLEQAFARFPRLVRDLSKTQNKEIDLEMIGTDIELDKTLVDHLSSPLVHLLRNAVDHGIESSGTIRIIVERTQGYAKVSVEDDGKPIDVAALKAVAEKQGFTKEETERINESSVLDLLCDPRFSSKGAVTDISGRGVGLSAVRETAAALGGQLTLTSADGVKRFTLSLPLQLSIIQALLVNVANDLYALPLMHVERLMMLDAKDIKTTMGQKAAVINEEDVPLIALSDLFMKKELKMKEAEEEKEAKDGKSCPIADRPTKQEHSSASSASFSSSASFQIVLIASDHDTTGLIVDKIIGNEEVMAKPVSDIIKNEEYFSGSTILGDGTVALILDIPSLIEFTKERLHTPPQKAYE